MRWLATLLLLTACHRQDEPPLTRALLAVGAPSLAARHAAEDRLDALVARAEVRLRAGEPAQRALPAALFDDLGFTREVSEADPRFMRLFTVLADGRGNCVGLGSALLAMGERLGPRHGFSTAGVLVPGHFFVRVAGHNVELLHRGEELPDSWYVQRFEVPARDAPEYLRALTPTEVLAVVDYNLGNDLTLQGRFADAASVYRRASRAFPQLAEAQASLGRVLHLSGALTEAQTAYQAARLANPHLPGLDRNLAVLREQLRLPLP